MARQATIHIVDDDQGVRESLLALLSTAELEADFESYASGEAFLQQADLTARGCVLLDVRLPDTSGLDILRQLSNGNSTLSVVIMTGHGDVPMAVEAMRAGALHFIEKPFDEEALLPILAEAISSSESQQQAYLTRQDALARLSRLTGRERDVLRLMVAGRLNKIIAYELGISARTVEVHRARVMEKLDVRSLSEVVRLALAAEESDLIPTT